MTQPQPQPKTLREISSASRYPVDAFHFIRRGLDYTVQRIHTDPEKLPEQQRHVSGTQLSEGLRDFAVDQYGLMARTVLRRWNINRTEDFGRIVFAMVDGGLMQATEHDSIRDFDAVFDFEQAFVTNVCLDKVPLEGFKPLPVAQG
jgi:uncharacterized repeat protein (TIGR04138 family)